MIKVPPAVLQALRAPTRYIKPKVMLEIGDQEVDITADVISVETTDEVSNSKGNLPFGVVSYNSCTLSLDNLDKRYLLNNKNSPYYGKLQSLMRVTIFYEIETQQDVFYKIPGGIYYTDFWKATTDAATASVNCKDILFQYGEINSDASPVYQNMSSSALLAQIFTFLGIPQGSFKIDGSHDITLKYFWTEPCKGKDLLEKVAQATCMNIFADASGILRTQSIFSNTPVVLDLGDTDLLMQVKAQPTFKDIYSECQIAFYTEAGFEEVKAFEMPETKIFPGRNVLSDIAVQKAPILCLCNLKVTSGPTIYVNTWTNTSGSCSISLTNSSEELQLVDIVGTAHAMKLQDALARKTIDSSVLNPLNIELPYVYSYTTVEQLCQQILQKYSSRIPSIEITIKGFPILELLDTVEVLSPTTGIEEKFFIQKIKHTFADGLTTNLSLCAVGGEADAEGTN